MSKIFKSVAPIGGAIVGGLAGGPAGALIGGALGGSLGAGSGPNTEEMMAKAMAQAKSGFSGNLDTNAFALHPGGLARRDLTFPKEMARLSSGLTGVAGQIGGLRGNIPGMRQGLVNIGGEMAGLRADVRPGFGRLTEAKVRSIRDAGAESMGNLRESLSRRGVMGSSFANDAQSRQRMATGQEEERARSEAVVAEISMSRQLMMDEITRIGAELGLNEHEQSILGQQASVIAQNASVVSSIMNQELQELAVAGNIRNGVNAIVSQQAVQMAQMQALTAQQQQQQDQGFAGLGAFGAAGLFGKSGALSGVNFGNLFGGGAG